MVSVMTGEITKEMQVVASGLMVMVIIYFMGAVSGAHLNPAVTIAFACRRHFPWQRVPWYLLAQLMGGLLAAAFLKAMFGPMGNVGATVPYPGFGNWKVLIMETVLTTGLINTILYGCLTRLIDAKSVPKPVYSQNKPKAVVQSRLTSIVWLFVPAIRNGCGLLKDR